LKTEAQFSRNICNQLRKHGIPHQRLEVTTGSGVPDLVVFYKGESIWLELKSKTYQLRAEQAVFAKRAWTRQVKCFTLIALGEISQDTAAMHNHMKLFITAKCHATNGKWRLDRDLELKRYEDFSITKVLDTCYHSIRYTR
jgi:Holliday junction resolvase